MDTHCSNSDVEKIGEVAGSIWHALEDLGPISLSKLVSHIGAPRDLVMQGVGWLAREGKVAFRKEARSKLIELA